MLLNRAPTLHRLGIQAFEPVSSRARRSRSTRSSASPSTRTSTATRWPYTCRCLAKPSRKPARSCWRRRTCSARPPATRWWRRRLDMVLGCYYMTAIREGATGEYTGNGQVRTAASRSDPGPRAGDSGLRALVRVRDRRTGMSSLRPPSGGSSSTRPCRRKSPSSMNSWTAKRSRRWFRTATRQSAWTPRRKSWTRSRTSASITRPVRSDDVRLRNQGSGRRSKRSSARLRSTSVRQRAVPDGSDHRTRSVRRDDHVWNTATEDVPP